MLMISKFRRQYLEVKVGLQLHSDAILADANC